MKKQIAGVMVAGLAALMITACGGSKTKVSNKAQSVGKSAIEVVDQYLDGDLDYDDVSDQLDELSEELDYTSEDSDKDKDTHFGDSSVQSDIVLLGSEIFQDHFEGTSDTYDDIVDKRNELAETIGEKKR